MLNVLQGSTIDVPRRSHAKLSFGVRPGWEISRASTFCPATWFTNNLVDFPRYHSYLLVLFFILHSRLLTPNLRENTHKMPAIRHASKRKAPPEGFSDIEDDLLIFSNKMKDAENASTNNVPKHKVHWPIFQISHQRSRYVYELYYEKEAISKQLYDWLLKNGYADAMLIAKWKKTGYEKVCSANPMRSGRKWEEEKGATALRSRLMLCSCAACGVFRRKRRISTRLVSAAYRKLSWKRTRR